MLLLVENQVSGFERILNQFHHCLSDKLIKKLIPLVARTKFGPSAIRIIMQSHCFRGIFFEKVKNHGLFTIKGSFEQFFQKYLASACATGKEVAKAVIEELQAPPFNLVFGLYMLKTEHYKL